MKGVLRIWLGSRVCFFSSCSTLRPREAWMWSHRNEVWWLFIWGGNCIATGRRRVDGEVIKNETRGERELEWRRPGKSPSCLWEGRKVGNSVCRCACLSGVGHKACQIQCDEGGDGRRLQLCHESCCSSIFVMSKQIILCLTLRLQMHLARSQILNNLCCFLPVAWVESREVLLCVTSETRNVEASLHSHT